MGSNSTEKVSHYTGQIGDLLGNARQELDGAEFLVVLSFVSQFTATMYKKKTQGSPSQAVDGLWELGRQFAQNHLRQSGIEA